MQLIKNSGSDRVVDELRKCLAGGATLLDVASPAFSLFAFSEIRELMVGLTGCRLVIPAIDPEELAFLGLAADRPFRNRLQARWLAKQCTNWIERAVEIRQAVGAIPQAMPIAGNPDSAHHCVITGNCTFSTEGLFTDDLRDKESAKIECGKAHFKALAVGENPAKYIVATKFDDLVVQ